MHILNLLLFLLPLSISAAVVDRITYVPGDSNDINTTSPNLIRRDSVRWGPDDTSQDACDVDAAPQRTAGSEFYKWDCNSIIEFNNNFGRYTINGYTNGRWAIINVRGTCSIAVARTDSSTNDYEVGDKDIRDSVKAAMNMYSDPIVMQSVTGEATCDAADTTGNDVPIKWWVVDPDDIPS